MSRLLYIQGSPLEGVSHSRTVGNAFVEAYRKAHPGDAVEVLDVFTEKLPPFDGFALRAKYSILHGKPHSKEEAAAWKDVEALIARFKAFDKYVFAVPMWNFGLPYRLKQYLDLIIQPGYTFSFSPQEGYKGLVTGKPAVAIYARGGEYEPGSSYDHQKSHLELLLGFIGFTDIRSVVIEPTLAGGPDTARTKREAALAQAVGLAKTL